MLYAQLKNPFSSKYRLLQGENGEALAKVKMGSFREGALLMIGEEEYTFRREKLMSGDFLLEASDGTIIACATKPSVWRDEFTITFGDLMFTLHKTSTWKRGFTLVWEGESAGEIRPKSWVSSTAVVDIPESLPLELRAFVLFLVLVMWRRYAAAAS